MDRPIVNIDEIELEHQEAGELFETDMAQLSAAVGASKLGYRLCVVPPGKRAWPSHAHLVNEEMVYVVSGSGTLKYAEQEWSIGAGDVISFVAAPDKPHQIVNTSHKELKYLCVSTMLEPEVVLYPDSGKFGVLAGSPPGGDKADRTFEIFAKLESGVSYWNGEL